MTESTVGNVTNVTIDPLTGKLIPVIMKAESEETMNEPLSLNSSLDDLSSDWGDWDEYPFCTDPDCEFCNPSDTDDCSCDECDML